MKKENGIKRLNRLSVKAKEYRDENTQVVKLSQAIEVIELIDQVGEPEKVVVPQFVADWFERNKGNLEMNLKALSSDSYNGEAYLESQEFMNWFNSECKNPIETLIKMQYGYEVEKEPQWIVNSGGDSYFVEFNSPGIGCTFSLKKERAYVFKEKSKAEAVSILVGGKAEEVSE